jgi:ATP diphosphatase
MNRLRDPQYGCPWDIKQTYATIVPHTLEEAYEVADAIERGDFDHLQGELGDLLFQVVYYSQLAREEGRFEFAGVVDSITRKLIRRHPHVFPTGDLYAPLDVPRLSEEQVKQRWEEIKAEERAEKSAAPEQLSCSMMCPLHCRRCRVRPNCKSVRPGRFRLAGCLAGAGQGARRAR